LRTDSGMLRDTEKKNVVEAMRELMGIVGRTLPLLLAVFLSMGPIAAQETADTAAADAPVVLDDTELAAAVRSRLESLDGFDAVFVEVEAGVVRLSGTVTSLHAWRRAEELTATLPGVVEVLNELEIDTNVMERVGALQETVSDAARFAPVIGFALLVLLLFLALSWLVGRWDSMFSRFTGNRFVQDMLQSGVRIALVLTGVVLALHIADATAIAGALVGTAGIVGIAIGFAFKDLVENYMASVLLSLRQPFEPNDHVDIDGFEGKVVRLTSRATVLMTLDGNHIRIPNGRVFKAVILNYSRNPWRRFDFTIGIAADADLAEAQDVGIRVLQRIPGVLEDPAPSSSVVEVGDSSMPIRFFAWVDQEVTNFGGARSEAIRLVKEAIEAAGIELPEPIYRVRTEPLEPPSQRRATTTPDLRLRSDISLQADPIIEQIVAERDALDDQGDLLDADAPRE
jgi:small conductance mechanosensitive channel